ncbi:carbohydrate-binding module family 50 protein [Diplodia corticola]|uniref:Carbohydrate-binding module family 50 protein n=1 Tax=Diplodia corticola TaxID=236234 RepID=A0A1J9RSK6_9PEZI|nr:carbohydrate-binding module family 50 protein [Diplodia corticola]OJD35539.1 carbohydrate-binding module family 50 protein [Diplodia corticola]
MSAKRWSSYDTDAYRLPSGITRIGYDDVSQKYLFRDSSGQEYTSASGSEYGRLEKAGWDGGPLLPRAARTGSESSASTGLKSPATDFSEILGGLDEQEHDEKEEEKSKPLPFLVLSSVLSFKSKLKTRQSRRAHKDSAVSSVVSKEKDYM